MGVGCPYMQLAPVSAPPTAGEELSFFSIVCALVGGGRCVRNSWPWGGPLGCVTSQKRGIGGGRGSCRIRLGTNRLRGRIEAQGRIELQNRNPRWSTLGKSQRRTLPSHRRGPRIRKFT